MFLFPVPTVYELFDRQLIMEATLINYGKLKLDDYEFFLKTEISLKEARNLKNIIPLKIKRTKTKNLSETYQIPIFKEYDY